MSIANDPVARIYLDIADEAFKRGLREANKQFKQSATEWNSHLEILKKSWGAVDRVMTTVFRTGFKLLREMAKGTDEAAKAARELRGDMKGVDDVMINLAISSEEFRLRVVLLNEAVKDFKERFGSPFWSDLRELIVDTGGKLVSFMLIPVTNFIRVTVSPMLFLFALVKNFQDSTGTLGERMSKAFSGATKSVDDLWRSMEKLRSVFRGDLPITEAITGEYDLNNNLVTNKFSMTDPNFLPGRGDSRSTRSRSKGKTDTGMRIGIKTRDLDFSRDTDIGIARFTPGDIAPEEEESAQEKRMARMRERYQADIQQMRDWKGQLSEAGLALGQSIGQGFAAGIAAMVSGTGSFMDEMRKMIGQFLVQIGTMLMSTAGGVLAGAALAAVFPPARPFLDPTGQAVPVALATLAAGGVLVATGSALSGAAGRSGTRSPQRVTPVRGSGASSAGFSGFGDLGGGGGNTTLIVNFNGPVSNPRRTAREFGSVLQSSGVTVGGT